MNKFYQKKIKIKNFGTKFDESVQVINLVLLLRNCCSSAEDEDDDPDVKAQREKERRQANNARER